MPRHISPADLCRFHQTFLMHQCLSVELLPCKSDEGCQSHGWRLSKGNIKNKSAFSCSKSCKAKCDGGVKLLQTALEDKISSTCYSFRRCSEDTEAVSALCLLYCSHLKRDSCAEPWRPQRLKAVIKEKVIAIAPRAL